MMRELTVYYCSACGFYGYYQLPQNAVCPHCDLPLTELHMTYQNFMRLEYQSRDKMIADQIAGDVVPYSSVIQRITELEKNCTLRLDAANLRKAYELLAEEHRKQDELLEQLRRENQELRRKNEENEATIKWMHDMIWDLTSKLHAKKPKT